MANGKQSNPSEVDFDENFDVTSQKLDKMRLSMKASKIQNIQYMREIGDETPTPIGSN